MIESNIELIGVASNANELVGETTSLIELTGDISNNYELIGVASNRNELIGEITPLTELTSDIESNCEVIGEMEFGALSGGTSNYDFLSNKPKINGIELIKDKTPEELGIQSKLIEGANVEIVDNVISIITTDEVEKDNTKPITSSAVYTEVGNINVLLQTI